MQVQRSYIPLKFNKSLLYRVKARMGISVFEEYDVNSYRISIVESIKEIILKKCF